MTNDPCHIWDFMAYFQDEYPMNIPWFSHDFPMFFPYWNHTPLRTLKGWAAWALWSSATWRKNGEIPQSPVSFWENYGKTHGKMGKQHWCFKLCFKLLNLWLVVSKMDVSFHKIWDVILPIDELILFRGVGIQPTRSQSVLKNGFAGKLRYTILYNIDSKLVGAQTCIDQ